MKLRNYYKKQLILIFAPYNFLVFLNTQLPEPKISEKNISEYFGKIFYFFQKTFTYSEDFSAQKIGGGYYKFRLNGSEEFNKIFVVGIFENLLAAKIELNCLQLKVVQFLLVIGYIIANYR